MTTTNFKTLLKEAVKTAERADELSKLHKMTAGAFLKSSMEIANTDHRKLDQLEKKLNQPLFESSRKFYRTSVKLLKEPNFSSPVKEARHLRWLADGRAEEVQTELSTIGSNMLELFSLAVREATKKFPETFGTVEDIDVHKQETEEAKQKREELFKKIETSFTSADLRFGNIGKGGATTVTFEVSGGEVPLGDHGGERLVNWLRNHPEAVKSL